MVNQASSGFKCSNTYITYSVADITDLDMFKIKKKWEKKGLQTPESLECSNISTSEVLISTNLFCHLPEEFTASF